jgi:hypothetical protein
MKHGNYSKEFVDRLTEDFLSGPLAQYDRQRIAKKIIEVRKADHCPIFLEMLHAVYLVQLEDAIKCIREWGEISKLDDLVNECYEEEAKISNVHIAYLANKPRLVAKTGGDARSALFKALEVETIRLYKLGKWMSLPLAALEITPKIVAFSRHGKGDLAETTNKPLEWLRKYVKSEKSKPS